MYRIIQSDTILNNHEQIVNDCRDLQKLIESLTYVDDPTADFDKYNIFALSTPSRLWYNLYKEVCTAARDFVGSTQPLWIEAWLNCHEKDDVLGWHGHSFDYHGYISILPHDTTTVFENFEMKNEVGNIYLGMGANHHYVRVDTPYEGERYTIGFDILTPRQASSIFKRDGFHYQQFIPVL